MLPMLMIVLCVVFRVLPHPPNFAPVGASAVFAGRTMKPAAAALTIIAAMFASDLALASLHGYSLFSLVTLFVYAGFMAQVALGRLLRKTKGGALGASLGGSLSFFALSNFGVWVASSSYMHNTEGLLTCYMAALPFLGGTLAGDLVWTAILSLLYQPAASRLEDKPGWVPVSLKEMTAL
jgi:hypothetical protein